MMILLTIKKYLSLALGLGVIVLGFLAKMFRAKAKKEEKRADQAEENFEFVIDVMEKDREIIRESDKKKAEAKDEIEKTGASTELSQPNADWVRPPKP